MAQEWGNEVEVEDFYTPLTRTPLPSSPRATVPADTLLEGNVPSEKLCLAAWDDLNGPLIALFGESLLNLLLLSYPLACGLTPSAVLGVMASSMVLCDCGGPRKAGCDRVRKASVVVCVLFWLSFSLSLIGSAVFVVLSQSGTGEVYFGSGLYAALLAQTLVHCSLCAFAGSRTYRIARQREQPSRISLHALLYS